MSFCLLAPRVDFHWASSFKLQMRANRIQTHRLTHSKRFKTMLQDTVDAFAREWGFIQTPSTVLQSIKRDRSQFSEYMKGKGIIATRERFLNWLETDNGQKAKTAQNVPLEGKVAATRDTKQLGKTLIVPVAIPGVGKTSIAIALSHLFGFAHTQSDDVHAKKVFLKNVVDLLKTNDVVIADRNNHLKMHRQELRDAVRDFDPPARLIALNWSFDQPLSTIHRICGDRVMARGEKHQTLRADTLAKAHEDVIWQFLKQAQELEVNEVNVAVEMDFDETLEEGIKRAADACVSILGLPAPTEEQFGEALAAARGYAPTTTRLESEKEKEKENREKGKKGKGKEKRVKGKRVKEKKKTAPRYFGILAEINLQSILAKRMTEEGVPTQGKKFWDHLVADNRVTPRPHVTIVHSKALSLPGETALWDRCMELHSIGTPPLFSFRLGHLVWNDRIMAATVVDLAVCQDEQDTDAKGVDFILHLSQNLKERLHITVGTGNSNIPAVEAGDLVGSWRQGKRSPEMGAVELNDVWVKGRVKGLVN